MKGEICICPKTWIEIKRLMRAGVFGAADSFIRKVEGKFRKATHRVKKRRTPKQIAATRKLVAWGKKHRRRRR